jgi:predicted nucleic acid-binding protein
LSERGRPARAVDTDIIYSRVLHELMGRVADDLRLLDLFWSEELLAEARRSLVERKSLTDEAAQRWVDYLPQHFPSGRTDIGQAAAAVDLAGLTTDPADHHVCALAVISNADYLFTHDRGYLRDGLRRHGVEVLAPDEFLGRAFDDHAPGNARHRGVAGERLGWRTARRGAVRRDRARRRPGRRRQGALLFEPLTSALRRRVAALRAARRLVGSPLRGCRKGGARCAGLPARGLAPAS